MVSGGSLVRCSIATSPSRAVDLLLGTGVRISEALGLKWSDVDLDRGEIRVTRTLYRRNNGTGWITKATKTERSRRMIPLMPATVAALFVSVTGRPLTGWSRAMATRRTGSCSQMSGGSRCGPMASTNTLGYRGSGG